MTNIEKIKTNTGTSRIVFINLNSSLDSIFTLSIDRFMVVNIIRELFYVCSVIVSQRINASSTLFGFTGLEIKSFIPTDRHFS